MACFRTPAMLRPAPGGASRAPRNLYARLTVTPLDDLTLTDDEGRDVALRDLWAERPAALVFLRHYG
jgi:hypothetical protein